METVKIGPKRTIALPRSIFKSSDEVIIVSTKDSLIIKKISTPHLSSIPSRGKNKTLSLKEIAKEVHRYRKERKKS